MSTEVEIMQQNTQRLTNVVDNYLNIVKESLSGMTEKIGRIAENISGDPLPTEPQVINTYDSGSVISTMENWKLDKLYDLISNLSNVLCISSDTPNNIDYEKLESVINEQISDFYEENGISDFISYDEILNEISSYEDSNGQISLDVDLDDANDTFGLKNKRDLTNIGSLIFQAFTKGQNDFANLEIKAKTAESLARKIKTDLPPDAPKMTEFLDASYCGPTNAYIESIGALCDKYNEILYSLIDEKTTVEEILQFIGYASGLANTTGDTDKIFNYCKFFKLHSNDLSVEMFPLNKIRGEIPTLSIDFSLQDTPRASRNPFDPTTETMFGPSFEQVETAIDALRGYTWQQYKIVLEESPKYNILASRLRTIQGMPCLTRGEFVEIRAIIAQLKNAADGVRAAMRVGNAAQYNACLNSLQVGARSLAQSLSNIFRSGSVTQLRQLVPVVIGGGVQFARMVGTAVSGMISAELLIIIAAIVIIAIVIWLLVRSTSKKAIRIFDEAIKAAIKAVENMNSVVGPVLSKVLDNVLKDLDHHDAKVYISVDDGLTTTECNISDFPDGVPEEFINRTNSELAQKYNGIPYTGEYTFILFQDETLYHKARSLKEILQSAANTVRPDETLDIIVVPDADGDYMDEGNHEILWKGGEWACGIHCYVDRSADITYEEVSNGGWEGYAYYIDDNGNEVIVDHALGTSELDKNSTEGWTQAQVDEYYSCRLPEAESVSINILGQTKTVTNIKWKIGDKLYNPGDSVRVPIVYISDNTPGIGKENLIHNGNTAPWCTAIAELQGDIA